MGWREVAPTGSWYIPSLFGACPPPPIFALGGICVRNVYRQPFHFSVGEQGEPWRKMMNAHSVVVQSVPAHSSI